MSLFEIPTVEDIRREKEGQLFERKSAMCHLLARLYPEQAGAVAAVVGTQLKWL
jgi:hypothetical protein